MPLYGHEMDDEVLPYEAGIGFFVNADKKDFIGKEALLAKKEASRRRIGLVIKERGIARTGDKVFFEGKEVGVVTSGSQSPILGAPICLARVDQSAAKMQDFTVEIRNKQVSAERIPLPFYKREK
jgi:aminomethyltransferase